jgi:hypothetical protein
MNQDSTYPRPSCDRPLGIPSNASDEQARQACIQLAYDGVQHRAWIEHCGSLA